MANIVTRATLHAFWELHKDCEQHLKTWYEDAKAANWASPTDVKAQFPTASILKDGRVVFNIKGNAYRLVVWINYRRQWIYVRFIGTHSDYDKIDANTI
jgi:mRNA interferase HigB